MLLQRLLGLRDLRFLVGQGAMVSQAQLSVLAMARLAVRCGHVCVRLVCVCIWCACACVCVGCTAGRLSHCVCGCCHVPLAPSACGVRQVPRGPPEKSRVAASSRTLPLLCLCQPV